MKTYKGKYKLKHPEKYIGDPKGVVYRSAWERFAFRWCENQKDVVKWGSEELVIPYVCATDNKVHRYFPDLVIEMENGKKIVVEIKPDVQTKPPKKPSRRTKRYINESMTYIKNQSKWQATVEFCENNGLEFQIWTEHTLKKMGMKWA